ILSHNEISKISKSLFKDMAHLIKVDMSHNKLKDVPSNAFYGAYELEEVDLSYNNLEWIYEDAFKNLPKLKGKTTKRDHMTTTVSPKQESTSTTITFLVYDRSSSTI